MGTRRALRVALIQAGRIVEDRTFTGRAKITVGTDAKSTFLVPMAEVPLTTAVFDITQKGTSLLFDRQMEGRVSIAGSEAQLQDYAASATPRGSRLSLSLPNDARGRVSVGEVSLLFQFVEQPKTPVAAELPKGARGLVAQLDRSFLAILAISLAAHFAGVGWLANQPVAEERDLTIEEMNIDRWASVVMTPPKPKKSTDPEQVAADAPKPKNVEPAKPKVASAPLSGEALKKRVRSLGMMGIIGSKGPNGESAFGDIMKDTGVVEIAEALRGAERGVEVASVDDMTASKRKGNETGGTSEIEPVGTNGVKRVDLKETLGPSVTGRVSTERIVVDTPEIDERALAQWIQGRKPAIQGCYEGVLKRSPTLKGRMVIRFAITSRGRVSNVGFDEDTLRSVAVQQCISGLMRGWVLPFTPEDEVPVSLPFIFTAGT